MNRRNHSSRFIGLLAASLVAGSPPAASDADFVRAHERIERSVVMITVEGGRINLDEDRSETFQATGSGFAIEPGLIVTNYHVIARARRIEVILSDRRISSKAVVVGTAPEFDVALLRVSVPEATLPPAPLGSAAATQVGESVIAVGHPFGLQHAISVGFVSGLHRELPGLDLGASLIQFSAPINPGQSGGPLIDSAGNVIGVTTAKILRAEAIGFAIPIDIVRSVVPDLERMGHAFRPQLGFDGVSIDPDFAALFGIPVEWGVLVQSVEDGSVAQGLGLAAGKRRVFLGGQEIVLDGDILVGIDDVPLHGAGDLTRRLIGARPGQEMIFSVIGPGGKRRVTVALPAMKH